jgi:protocatechuate 3,4-dioxygenase beta subunit
MHSTGTIHVDLPKSADFQTRLILRHDGADQAQFNGELLDGTYQVQLELEHRAGDCRWKRAQEVEIDLVDGETRKVDFKFEPPMTISGEVKDAKKKPVGGAKVIASRVFEHNSLLKILTDGSTGFLEESRCVTDAFGRFTLEGLEAGTYHVLAHHPDHPPVSLDLEAGDQQAKFALVPPAPEKTEKAEKGP